MIAVIDYGLGNLGSIQNMLGYLGAESEIISSPHELHRATKLILPGVGAFDSGMEHLQANNWVPTLQEAVFEKHMPLLGICLGMQLLTEGSEEGKLPGLGWIGGRAVRFDSDSLKVPHMGWNTTQITRSNKLVTQDGETKFYYVHSYHVKLTNANDEILNCGYGERVTVGVERQNIVGVQFHPEKSHRHGMQLLRNFLSNY